MDLDGALVLKENAWMAAMQTKQHLEEQLRGVSTHILRLEGAMTQLKELGAKPTGRLGSNDAAIAAHTAGNEVLAGMGSPATEPAPPPEPEPTPEPAPQE